MGRKSKKVLAVFIFAAIVIPVAMGAFCHCCEAAPNTQVTLASAEDHSCCPESVDVPNCQIPAIHQAKFLTPSQSFNALIFQKDFSFRPVLAGYSHDSDFEHFPAGFDPPGFHQPLFLSLQVLRI